MSDRRSSPECDRATRAIDEQAAEWFGRCEIGLTPDEERAFVHWLELDPRHGEAFREMDDTWDVLDRLKHSQKLRAIPLPSTSSTPERTPATIVSFLRLRRTSCPMLLAAAAAIALAFTLLRPTRQTPAIVRQVATDAGGMKQMELPDGSVIHLNASSRVAVRLTAAERCVELLQGEAHFTVAKDPDRPFVVHAGAVAVRAVGTAFNVRRAEQDIEVFVTEGRVRLDDSTRGKSLLLAPRPTPSPAGTAATSPVTPSSATPAPVQPDILVAGQRAVVALSPTATPSPAVVDAIAEPDMQRALAWRARQLEFDLTPLAEVAAEFNRYNTHQLIIADPELARETFGGSFRADNYDVFVQLLEKRFNVTAERSPESTTLRRTR